MALRWHEFRAWCVYAQAGVLWTKFYLSQASIVPLESETRHISDCTEAPRQGLLVRPTLAQAAIKVQVYEDLYNNRPVSLA